VFVPASAKTASISVRAVQTGGPLSASATYNIVATADARFSLSTSGGDAQTGAPGTALGQPLRITVTDASGDPAPGQTVAFAASQGAMVAPTTAITDAKGQASATLRLPSSEGLTLATASAAHQVVTFSARAQAFSLTNFPALSQAFDAPIGNGPATIRQSGDLLAAVAGIVRYRQTRGELAQPNGLADAFALNAFLSAYCVTDTRGNKNCDGLVMPASGAAVVNLWRVAAFVGGGVDVSLESTDVNSLRDLVAAGSPVLLVLVLPNGGGMHFVVATGIDAAGSLLIADSNPALARPRLDDYLSAQTRLTGAARLIPRIPVAPGFLITASAAPQATFAGGSCGSSLALADSLNFLFCDGSAGLYQLDLGGGAATFTDLGASGAHIDLTDAAANSLAITRSGAAWSIAPLDVTFTAVSVVNAASLTSDVSPGGLISIFGAGFVRAGGKASVQVNGADAAILAALPFQINAQIPPGAVTGAAALSVTLGSSTVSQSVTIKDVAPAIFVVGPGIAAITNQDNSLNTATNPAPRTQAIVIYGTGFGATVTSGALSVARTPITAVIGGAEIATAFAGLTPRAVGLYQANVILPSAIPPGLALPLFLKQGAAVSNVVTVAVQ
jgi:uncharacterized protein (TIGR03437 family)